MWVANLASLELHTSLSRGADIDRPSMMVFDLDPGAPATIVECAQVGLWLRELLDDLGLESVAKTSGSKGLQLYVPLNTPATYSDTKSFSHALAQLLERREPKLVVSQMAKELRKGKVFIDWSQNDRVKTTVCVYSLRLRDRPTPASPGGHARGRACSARAFHSAWCCLACSCTIAWCSCASHSPRTPKPPVGSAPRTT